MRNQLSVQVDRVIFFVIVITSFLVPLFFLTLTTEYFETPKLILLISLSLIALALWCLKWLLRGKISFVRASLDLPLLMLLIVTIISTLLSSARYVSIYGNFPQVHGSAISWVSYIIFYFLLVSQIRQKKQVLVVYFALLLSTTLISLTSILSYFNIYPLATILPFSKISNFTLTGSSFGATSMALLMFPFGLLSILKPNKLLPLPLAIFLSTLFGLTLILVGSELIILLAVVTLISILFIAKNNYSRKHAPLLLLPIGICALVFLLGFLPLDKKLNPLVEKRINFPKEIQIPLSTSWKVAGSAFTDSPFFGTGPSTYLFDFSLYKPLEHNSTKYWNVRFDSGFNEFLEILATLGTLGLISLILLSVVTLSLVRKTLTIDDNPFVVSLAISAFLVVMLLLVHASTLTSILASIVILALLVASYKSKVGKVEELTLQIQTSNSKDSQISSNLVVGDVLPIVVVIPLLIILVAIFWYGQKAVLADYYHRKALNAASSNSLTTYNNLVKSEQLNPYIDIYRTDLAQTNFALANAIASQKGPSQTSPSGSLTDQDKRNIQTLISQAINEARVATQLNPQSPQNWEILASIYRQISGVAQNAMTFSLDSYGKAIARDPLNPLLRLSIGGIYYSMRNYDLAVRFFTDSINLKSDFANGYYNLSVALRDKGDLETAKAMAEQVLKLIDSKSPDYKMASDYLDDLESRIATGSTQQSSIIPPAAEEKGPLQKKNLPKILDKQLPEPEKIATPEAIKK